MLRVRDLADLWAPAEMLEMRWQGSLDDNPAAALMSALGRMQTSRIGPKPDKSCLVVRRTFERVRRLTLSPAA